MCKFSAEVQSEVNPVDFQPPKLRAWRNEITTADSYFATSCFGWGERESKRRLKRHESDAVKLRRRRRSGMWTWGISAVHREEDEYCSVFK